MSKPFSDSNYDQLGTRTDNLLPIEMSKPKSIIIFIGIEEEHTASLHAGKKSIAS